MPPADQPPRITHEPPTIAVVTPSYEMAGFLRETIESLLAQNWPRLDYLIMDGGSRDGTRELLESYGDRIRWVSGPDGGQADAINRGFERTRGQIFAFLNADDTYRPGALAAAAVGFDANPKAAVVYGDADLVDGAGATVMPFPTEDFDRARLQHGCFLSQPAAFVRREAWSDVGGLNAGLRYALDYDLWIRMSERRAFARIAGTLATSRMHADNKSLGERGGLYRESLAVVQRHFGYVPMSWLEQYARYLVDRVDQLYENSDPSRRSRAVALALGLRHNPTQPRRFWRDWQSDGYTDRFRDGWMSKVHESRHEIPAETGKLIIVGRHVANVRRPLVLTVFANGIRLGRALIRQHGRFELSFDVPAHLRGRPCVVRIVSAWTWRPGARRRDNRRLSCLLDGVAPAT